MTRLGVFWELSGREEKLDFTFMFASRGQTSSQVGQHEKEHMGGAKVGEALKGSQCPMVYAPIEYIV